MQETVCDGEIFGCYCGDDCSLFGFRFKKGGIGERVSWSGDNGMGYRAGGLKRRDEEGCRAGR